MRIGQRVVYQENHRSDSVSNVIDDVLLPLLHASVASNVVLQEIPIIQETTWQRLFEIAAKQGVLALLYEVICQLPESVQPPRMLKLRWALSVEAIERRYEQQIQVVHELSELYGNQGIRSIVLKGIGLSVYYPRPEHRECGDIDLLLDDYIKGNEIIERLGITVNRNNEKHAVFYYKGVMVENHCNLLAFSHHKTEKLINEFLNEEAEHCLRVADGGYYLPSPMFNVLYLFRHMARHFGIEGINLRILLDWGLFLRNNRHQIDFDKIQSLCAACGYEAVYDIFTELAGELIGEDFTSLLVNRPDVLVKRRVWNDILNFGFHRESSSKRGVRFVRKCRKIFSCRWKYQLLLPESFWRDIVYPSLVLHLRHPQEI